MIVFFSLFRCVAGFCDEDEKYFDFGKCLGKNAKKSWKPIWNIFFPAPGHDGVLDNFCNFVANKVCIA